MLKEFKEFAMKGNLVDMAVAFVMGAAFGKVVTSFINGIVMPVVGLLTGGVNFNAMKFVLKAAQLDATGAEVSAEVAIQYGAFITNILDFVLVAFFMFMLIKAINKSKKKKEAAPAAPPAPPAPSEEQKLLAEIRDLLKKQ